MPKQRKTKEEKIRTGYRLGDFQLKAEERVATKDKEEFGYLSAEYVKSDLIKTFIYTLIIVSLLLSAKQYLG